MTTLAELKQAIDAVPKRPSLFTPTSNAEKWIEQWEDYHKWLANAWRAAFAWRDTFTDERWTEAQEREYLEGMALIREKLK